MFCSNRIRVIYFCPNCVNFLPENAHCKIFRGVDCPLPPCSCAYAQRRGEAFASDRESLATIVNGNYPLTIVPKFSILDACGAVPGYVSVTVRKKTLFFNSFMTEVPIM